MSKTEHKSFASPDEVRTFEKGKLELVTIGGAMVGRFTLQPGWMWSKHVKPLAKTELCMNHHFQYVISGHMHGKMADGSDFVVGPGEILDRPHGTTRGSWETSPWWRWTGRARQVREEGGADGCSGRSAIRRRSRRVASRRRWPLPEAPAGAIIAGP